MAVGFKILLEDNGRLIEKLKNAGDELGLKSICIKQLTQMKNKAADSYTPKDTGELRLSARVDLNALEMGYTKEYAPHVEFGHRTRNGGGMGYVPGQKYLLRNVEDQAKIFRADLEKRVKDICDG